MRHKLVTDLTGTFRRLSEIRIPSGTRGTLCIPAETVLKKGRSIPCSGTWPENVDFGGSGPKTSFSLPTHALNDKEGCHSQRASENRRWTLRLYGRRLVERAARGRRILRVPGDPSGAVGPDAPFNDIATYPANLCPLFGRAEFAGFREDLGQPIGEPVEAVSRRALRHRSTEHFDCVLSKEQRVHNAI